jgi:hypothetical protein
LVSKPPGKPTLAPLSDKRPPLNEITPDVFSNLDGDDSDI